MSAKVKKISKPEKKPAKAAAPAKAGKEPKEAKEAKASAKGGKKDKAAAAEEKDENAAQPQTLGPDGQPIDLEELEEQQEEAAASASKSNSDAAALAAAGGATEMSASFKNFRHHPDMENFYRFIFDNDLRHEALEIIDQIITEKKAKKLNKGARA